MIKAKDRVSDDVGAEFSDIITEEFLDKVCEILDIQHSDTVEVKTFQFKKREQLSLSIKLAYMKCRPDIDTKNRAPSKKAEKLRGDISAIKKLKEKMLPLCPNKTDIPYGEMDENDLHVLRRLQRIGNKMSDNPTKEHPVFSYLDSDKLYLHYEFDRKVDQLIETLDWLEECFEETKQSFEEEKTSAKRPQNKNSKAFFISLCNLYYEYTEKKPESTYTNNDNYDFPVGGDIIDFLELCYEAFELKHTRRSSHDFLQEIIKEKFSPTTKFISNIIPQWL